MNFGYEHVISNTLTFVLQKSGTLGFLDPAGLADFCAVAVPLPSAREIAFCPTTGASTTEINLI